MLGTSFLGSSIRSLASGYLRGHQIAKQTNKTSTLTCIFRSYCNTKPNQPSKSDLVVTRFAPSPTGLLHIGGLRTALFNFLYTRQNKGVFMLRIEDTDRERFVPDSQDNIIDTLEWAGVTYDEGPRKEGKRGPYIQSERLPIYRKHAEELVQSGKAYRCFCTKHRLEALRKAQEQRDLPTMYDRFCMRLPAEKIKEKLQNNEPYVIRFKVMPGTTIVDDKVMGKVAFSNRSIDDQILLKSDGFPTYHLASVVDDHLMGVTDVIRGEEWLPSAPKHVMLYEAFGWKLPIFRHLPLLLNEDKTKLSKRNAHTSAKWYRDNGYLPEAVVNYIALLGWNPGDNQEFFTMDDLLKRFSIANASKSPAIVDLNKLGWINSLHIRHLAQTDPGKLREYIRYFFMESIKDVHSDHFLLPSWDKSQFDSDYCTNAMRLLAEESKCNDLMEFVIRLRACFLPPNYSHQRSTTFITQLERSQALNIVNELIVFIEEAKRKNIPWNKAETSALLQNVFDYMKILVEKEQPGFRLTKSHIFQTARYAFTGAAEGAELPLLMTILGPSGCITRLKASLPTIKSFVFDYGRKKRDDNVNEANPSGFSNFTSPSAKEAAKIAGIARNSKNKNNGTL